MKRRNPFLFLFGVVVSAIFLVVFVAQGISFFKGNDDKPLTTLNPQGTYSASIQTLVGPVFYIAAFVFFAVIGAIVYIGVRFRDTGDPETADEIPTQIHGKTFLEIAWTILPALVLLFVGLGTVVTLSNLNAIPKSDAVKVRVEGQQWWWRFSYDANGNNEFGDSGDVVTANELVIPVGREIALTETSNDVIHSFWIPALNGKKDAVPGFIDEWKIEADHPGVYRGQCTEYCGLSHANMRMLVRAVSQTDYDRWFANQQLAAKTPAAGSTEEAGMKLFKGQLCANCHLIRGVTDETVGGIKGVKTQLVSGVAPDLTHFASRGTFAGSIFNSHYPNPADLAQQPFGQTCQVRGEKGSGLGADGQAVDVAGLPACPEADQPDAFEIPYASSEPGNPDNPNNRVALAAWLRDPPSMKPMSPLLEDNPYAEGKRRGMPNLKLSEDQINLLVTYLNSLK